MANEEGGSGTSIITPPSTPPPSTPVKMRIPLPFFSLFSRFQRRRRVRWANMRVSVERRRRRRGRHTHKKSEINVNQRSGPVRVGLLLLLPSPLFWCVRSFIMLVQNAQHTSRTDQLGHRKTLIFHASLATTYKSCTPVFRWSLLSISVRLFGFVNGCLHPKSPIRLPLFFFPLIHLVVVEKKDLPSFALPQKWLFSTRYKTKHVWLNKNDPRMEGGQKYYEKETSKYF